MQNNTFYPIALILIIGIAFYFLYGEYLSPKNIDLSKYQEVCNNYLLAPPGTYSDAEMQSLVNKVSYILPEELSAITVPIEREVKTCAIELADRLSKAKP